MTPVPHNSAPADVPELSVVVPLYDEADNVGPLCEALTRALEPLGRRFEVLLVDDGSTDGTFSRVAALCAADPRLRAIRFRRNHGQTAAMAAGFEHARGGVIVTLDGDLQNDPADIPALLAKMAEGYDLVAGWRQGRRDRLLTRRLPSVAANWLIGRVTGVPIRDNGCTLKAYRAELIRSLPLYSEMHRFLPAMASLAGARIAEIPVRHHPRRYGRSKYGLSRVYRVLLDLAGIKIILSFLSRPLLGFALLACAAAVPAVALSAAGLAPLLAGRGEASVVLAGSGTLFGALALMLLFWGVLGELVYRTGDVKLERFAVRTMRTTAPPRGTPRERPR